MVILQVRICAGRQGTGAPTATHVHMHDPIAPCMPISAKTVAFSGNSVQNYAIKKKAEIPGAEAGCVSPLARRASTKLLTKFIKKLK